MLVVDLYESDIIPIILCHINNETNCGITSLGYNFCKMT